MKCSVRNLCLASLPCPLTFCTGYPKGFSFISFKIWPLLSTVLSLCQFRFPHSWIGFPFIRFNSWLLLSSQHFSSVSSDSPTAGQDSHSFVLIVGPFYLVCISRLLVQIPPQLDRILIHSFYGLATSIQSVFPLCQYRFPHSWMGFSFIRFKSQPLLSRLYFPSASSYFSYLDSIPGQPI